MNQAPLYEEKGLGTITGGNKPVGDATSFWENLWDVVSPEELAKLPDDLPVVVRRSQDGTPWLGAVLDVVKEREPIEQGGNMNEAANRAAETIVRGWHGVTVLYQTDDGGRERTVASIAEVIHREQSLAEWDAKVAAEHSPEAKRVAQRLLESGRLHDYAGEDGVADVEAIIDEEFGKREAT